MFKLFPRYSTSACLGAFAQKPRFRVRLRSGVNECAGSLKQGTRTF